MSWVGELGYHFDDIVPLLLTRNCSILKIIVNQNTLQNEIKLVSNSIETLAKVYMIYHIWIIL